MSNVTRNAILSIKIAVNEQAERYHPNTSEFEPILEHIDKLLEQYPEQKKVSIGGKVVHGSGMVTLVFKVKGKLYAHTKENGEIIDQYLHTGDATVLDQLSNEVPF